MTWSINCNLHEIFDRIKFKREKHLVVTKKLESMGLKSTSFKKFGVTRPFTFYYTAMDLYTIGPFIEITLSLIDNRAVDNRVVTTLSTVHAI